MRTSATKETLATSAQIQARLEEAREQLRRKVVERDHVPEERRLILAAPTVAQDKLESLSRRTLALTTDIGDWEQRIALLQQQQQNTEWAEDEIRHRHLCQEHEHLRLAAAPKALAALEQQHQGEVACARTATAVYVRDVAVIREIRALEKKQHFPRVAIIPLDELTFVARFDTELSAVVDDLHQARLLATMPWTPPKRTA